MSGDLTARDVIAREVLPGIVVDGRLEPDYHEADRVLAALAAAGWSVVKTEALRSHHTVDAHSGGMLEKMTDPFRREVAPDA